jgi:hypothetical protein
LEELEEFSVIWQRLLIVWIMKCCEVNYISVEFEEYEKTGSDPIQLPEGRKLSQIT